jgi:hypothetical protein
MGNVNDGHFMGAVILISIPSHLSLLAKGIPTGQYLKNKKLHTYTIQINTSLGNDCSCEMQKMN